MNITDVLIVIAAVVWVMARRLSGQLLEVKSLFLLPVVLTIVGITQVEHLHPRNATTAAFVGVSVAISVVLGLLRGTTVHLGERAGKRGAELWMRYRPLTVVLWVVNIAVKFASVPVERGVSHASSAAAGHALMLSIGLGILAESGVVLLRALPRRTQLVWSKGEHGAPHTTSVRLDTAQQVLRTGPTSADGRVRVTDLRRAARSHHDW